MYNNYCTKKKNDSHVEQSLLLRVFLFPGLFLTDLNSNLCNETNKQHVTVPVSAAPEGCWPPLFLCDTDPPAPAA